MNQERRLEKEVIDAALAWAGRGTSERNEEDMRVMLLESIDRLQRYYEAKQAFYSARKGDG